jgi:hypothetical protein
MLPHGTEFVLREFSRRRYPVRNAIARAILERGSLRGNAYRISVDELARLVYGSSSQHYRRNLLQNVYLMSEANGVVVTSEGGTIVCLEILASNEERSAI